MSDRNSEENQKIYTHIFPASYDRLFVLLRRTHSPLTIRDELCGEFYRVIYIPPFNLFL